MKTLHFHCKIKHQFYKYLRLERKAFVQKCLLYHSLLIEELYHISSSSVTNAEFSHLMCKLSIQQQHGSQEVDPRRC